MKWIRLTLVAIAVLTLSLVGAQAEEGSNAEATQSPEVVQSQAAVTAPEVENTQDLELSEVTLESLLGPTSSAGLWCIDSGIPCSSASQCKSVCSPYTCVCNGTCMIC